MKKNDTGATFPWQAFNSTEFNKLGQQQAQAMTEVQQEVSALLQQAGEDWRARVEVEQEVTSELTSQVVRGTVASRDRHGIPRLDGTPRGVDDERQSKIL